MAGIHERNTSSGAFGNPPVEFAVATEPYDPNFSSNSVLSRVVTSSALYAAVSTVPFWLRSVPSFPKPRGNQSKLTSNPSGAITTFAKLSYASIVVTVPWTWSAQVLSGYAR